jgi:N-acyl-D-aspartate/D-glutamate deacylase
VGADADIVVFDPDKIIDRGEYGENSGTPPEGISCVIVNGILTVKDSELVPDVKAGKVIRRTWRVPGYSAK